MVKTWFSSDCLLPNGVVQKCWIFEWGTFLKRWILGLPHCWLKFISCDWNYLVTTYLTHPLLITGKGEAMEKKGDSDNFGHHPLGAHLYISMESFAPPIHSTWGDNVGLHIIQAVAKAWNRSREKHTCCVVVAFYRSTYDYIPTCAHICHTWI